MKALGRPCAAFINNTPGGFEPVISACREVFGTVGQRQDGFRRNAVERRYRDGKSRFQVATGFYFYRTFGNASIRNAIFRTAYFVMDQMDAGCLKIMTDTLRCYGSRKRRAIEGPLLLDAGTGNVIPFYQQVGARSGTARLAPSGIRIKLSVVVCAVTGAMEQGRLTGYIDR